MRLIVSIVLTLIGIASAFGVPETINIQGSLSDGSGNPLVGTRAYRIQFFDSAEGGASLGSAIDGFVTPSAEGRFSIDLAPSAQVFGVSEVFYSLGIDSSVPSDGDIDPEDVFPERVKIHSVLFAREAEDANSAETAIHALSADTATSASLADHATTADMAMTLSGQLTDPGDQIPLGGGVVLQVADDGTVEFLTGGQRLRLAGQKWFDPKNLLDNISPDGTRAEVPQVALNNNGEAVIVWRQTVGANTQVFRSEYRNGSWTDPSNLADNLSPDGQDAFSPQVAISDNGEAVVVWTQSDGSNIQIFRSEYRNGSWTDPADLMDNISPDGERAGYPEVALGDNGDAVIVWQQIDGATDQIFRSEYRDGSWSDPTSLTDNISPDGQDAFEPQVAMNDNGDAVIVWYQSDGMSQQVFRSEYRNGSWTDPASLMDNISPDGQTAFSPQVALSDNGDAVIVWYQSDGSNDQTFRSEYRDGSWIDPSSLSDNISPDGKSASNSQVAMNGNGDAIIVWYQSDGANLQIFRSEYRSGTWRDPSSLLDNISPNGGHAAFPQAELNNNGDAIIAWEQNDGMFNQIFRSEFRFGF